MQSKFEMSMVGELSFFLGFQIKQMHGSIFISQSKYAKNIIKKFGLEKVSHKNTPAATNMKLSKDEAGEAVDQSPISKHHWKLVIPHSKSSWHSLFRRSLCTLPSQSQSKPSNTSQMHHKVHCWNHWSRIIIFIRYSSNTRWLLRRGLAWLHSWSEKYLRRLLLSRKQFNLMVQ